MPTTITIYAETATNYGVDLTSDEQRVMDSTLDAETTAAVEAAYPECNVQIIRNLGGAAPGSDGTQCVTTDDDDRAVEDHVRDLAGRVWRSVCERYSQIVTEVIACECGEWCGEHCNWSGDASETVVVEYMPEQHRASHVAARNRGVYPHNGARRIRVEKSCADRMVEHDGDWCSIVEA